MNDCPVWKNGLFLFALSLLDFWENYFSGTPLSNAVKFTDKGEVVTSITSRSLAFPQIEEKKNRYEIHFTVKDTGIGIPQDRIAHLFQPFTQLDASTTRKYGGTGLGLIICKRLVEMMGGKIWVESEGTPGRGSAFHFTIIAEAISKQTAFHLQSAHPAVSGKKLLIVDDNTINRRTLSLQTKSWGMLPVSTTSSTEALAWIEQGDQFDLAILDMQMPEMDGLTLAAKIRKHYDAQSLPLVILTSIGQQGFLSQTSQLDLAAFLTKPVKPVQLHDTLVGIFAKEMTTTSITQAADWSQVDAKMGQRYPLRILLAEDNAINQKVTLRILERMGYRADVAANGLEVLEALMRQIYDVVLMDVRMPEMDGIEATQLIRQQWPFNQQPRVIALTADALVGDRENIWLKVWTITSANRLIEMNSLRPCVNAVLLSTRKRMYCRPLNRPCFSLLLISRPLKRSLTWPRWNSSALLQERVAQNWL